MVRTCNTILFPSSYELIQDQFQGNGSCFTSYYLLEDSQPILYNQFAYKVQTSKMKQTNLTIQNIQAVQYDSDFLHDLYQINKNVSVKLRRFVGSIIAESNMIVNSILVTGIDNNGNEKPFCQLILDTPFILDKYDIYDFELFLLYPIPVVSDIIEINIHKTNGNILRLQLLSQISDTDFSQLIESHSDNMKSFSCGEIFTTNIESKCFDLFDLFNYYLYSSVHNITNQELQSTNFINQKNTAISFRVIDNTSVQTQTTTNLIYDNDDVILNFDVEIPLTSLDHISGLQTSNGYSTLYFEEVFICKNYINEGHNYFTVEIGVNLTQWMKYLTFLIN